jgi:hypothetical protein
MFKESLYRARATRWGLTETVNGNPRFWMTFDVIGLADKNDLAADSKPCESGSGLWSITPTTAKTAEWLIATVQSLGYDRPDLLGLDPDREDAFDFTDVEFFVTCKHEEYQGEVREKWAVFTPPSRPKLAADKLLALNERYGSVVKEMKDRREAKEQPKPNDTASSSSSNEAITY